jgi:F-type H+-transporting ATPase subunit b
MSVSRLARLALAAALLATPGAASEPSPDGDPTSQATPESGDAASGHGAHHEPTWHDINWFYGMIGEREGAEPGLLFRPVGMPVPLGAMLLNTALLFYLLGRFGAPAVRSGLEARRERLAGAIDAAARMKEEAAAQLARYETRLAEMSSEMERIKREMREQAEADRARILAEAKDRRVALEQETRRLLEQELAEAREHALRIAVGRAMALAATRIEQGLSEADHERLGANLVGALEQQLKQGEARS